MRPERKKMRLEPWDYNAPGVYFLTFCTMQKRPILSHIVGRDIPDAPLVHLTGIGQSVESALRYMAHNSPKWKLHHYIIMPNHVHLLLELRAADGEGSGASRMSRPAEAAVPRFVSYVKRYTNREWRRQLWQDGYYDHVVRDEQDFLRIWNYMDGNPFRWVEDMFCIEEEEPCMTEPKQ